MDEAAARDAVAAGGGEGAAGAGAGAGAAAAPAGVGRARRGRRRRSPPARGTGKGEAAAAAGRRPRQVVAARRRGRRRVLGGGRAERRLADAGGARGAAGRAALQLIGCLDKLPDAAAEAVANRLISPTARFLLQGKIFRGPRGYLQHRLRVRTFWAPGFEIHVEDVRHDRTGELPGHQDAPTTRVSWTLKGRPWDGPAAQGSDVRMSSGSDMDADAAAEGSSEGGNGVEPTVTARGVTVLSFEGHTCVGGMNSYDFQRACQSLSPSAFGGAPSAAGGSAVATPLQTGELRREPRPHGVNEMEALRHYRRATRARAEAPAGARCPT